MKNGTHQFFTAQEVGQVTGAIVVVTAVSATVRQLTGVETPWIAFLLSMLVTYTAAGAAGCLTPVRRCDFPRQAFFTALISWILPGFNACILFTTAVGTTQVAGLMGGR